MSREFENAATIPIQDAWDGIDICYANGWTDGLPVIPPTPERVEAFLAAGGFQPGDVLLREPVRGRQVTADKVAINAVMAGCLPEYMPVVSAALEAMSDPDYGLHGPLTSTGGAAPLIIVNGPLAKTLGINGGVNLFGPGTRANATIGRAIRLIYLNCLGAHPGVLDKSTQGWPGKYSACFAELEESSPWEPYHVENGYAADVSTVTVFAAEAPHNIANHVSNTAEGILSTVADAMAALGSFGPGQTVLVLCPEHINYIAADRWTKRQVKQFLYERAKRTRADMKRLGKMEGQIEPGDESEWIHRGLSPDDILVFVGGGNAGGHSAFFPAWGQSRGSIHVTKPIRKER